jgi:putative ABC transport system permease protein
VIDFFHNIPLVVSMVFLGVFVGLLSGSYPALVLSSFQPTEVLKGKTGTIGSKDFLRKALVVGQFVISISLIICIGIVYKQLHARTARAQRLPARIDSSRPPAYPSLSP